MKDNVITITKEDGSTEDMKVITVFENNNKNYMIYQSIEDGSYYGASYNDNDEIDADLSDEEKAMMNEAFKALRLGGENNA